MKRNSPAGYYHTILDAIPSPIFLVDEDVAILDYNQTAVPLLGEEPRLAVGKRTGEALRCFHATETAAGCGGSPVCVDCMVRNAVKQAFRGHKTFRSTTRLQIKHQAALKEVFFMVTTTPCHCESVDNVLLILEDINELVALRKMLPMCASCRRIRDEKDYWSSVEIYFKSHLDVDFTHSLCPECMKKYRPVQLAHHD